MNEFTKEELEEIQEYGRHSVELHEKIQLLIEKYCEHDCKNTIFIRTVTACSKCDYPIGAYRGNK